MSTEAIISNITNWFQRYIGKYILRKTKLRQQYKERLIEIVNDYAEVMADRGRTCSLISLISTALTDDGNLNHQIQGPLSTARILQKWYSQYRESPNFVILKNVSHSFNQFAGILHETRSVFEDFFQVIRNEDTIIKKLKGESYGYPYFEKIYDRTTKDFERLCKDARKELKDEFKEHKFGSLPRL